MSWKDLDLPGYVSRSTIIEPYEEILFDNGRRTFRILATYWDNTLDVVVVVFVPLSRPLEEWVYDTEREFLNNFDRGRYRWLDNG